MDSLRGSVSWKLPEALVVFVAGTLVESLKNALTDPPEHPIVGYGRH
jgi:hypothetical protein